MLSFVIAIVAVAVMAPKQSKITTEEQPHKVKRCKTAPEEQHAPVVQVDDKACDAQKNEDEKSVSRGSCSRFLTAMNYTINKAVNPDADKQAKCKAALEDHMLRFMV